MSTTAHEDQCTPAPVEMTQLKPCPNPWGCDHRHQPVCTHMNFDGNSRLRHVVCHGCGLRGPVRETKALAEAAWNTRTASAPAGEVVAWMYDRPGDPFPPAIRTDRYEASGLRLMARNGWTETPLYAHPPAPADLVEALRILRGLAAAYKLACDDLGEPYYEAQSSWYSHAEFLLAKHGVA